MILMTDYNIRCDGRYLCNFFIITFQIIELINVSNKNNSARSNYSSSNVRMIKVGALTLQFWLFMLLTYVLVGCYGTCFPTSYAASIL